MLDIHRFIDYICLDDAVQDNDCQAMSGFGGLINILINNIIFENFDR